MAKVGTLTFDIKPGEALRALAEANKTIDAMLVKVGEQVKDVEFLALRAEQAGKWSSLEDGRDTGASSNFIVSLAYGISSLDKQAFPSDQSDMDACRRVLDKLPIHRITKDVHEAMFRATQALAVKQREFAGRL